jgi:pyridoxamine 5'-phosphate oxidase
MDAGKTGRMAALREDQLAGLDESDLDPDPIRQFQTWFDAAVQAGAVEPEAMTLATAGADGRPSARIVLLKRVDHRGFVFFTNYESRKGRQLAANPSAALVFRWEVMARQVCVTGSAMRVGEAESDAYFASRPYGSQLGAWTSAQSTVLPDRATLDRHAEEIAARFAGRPIPRPPFWGGFVVIPDTIAFWQRRPNRLHDRLRYRLEGQGWVIERLSP